MDSEPQVNLENLCMSGGAPGSDEQWGMMAGRLGHKVLHWSFEGHRTAVPEGDRVQLSQVLLNQADVALARANVSLGRHWPSRNPDTNNLLRRNWYQVKDTRAVYAVGVMEAGHRIKGGSAWAIQMYMDRFLIDGEDINQCQLYFCHQPTGVWWEWRGKWSMRINAPPVPKGIWTGIGTRDLTSDGKWQIRKTMGGYPVGPEQIAAVHPTIEEPKVGDIIYVPDGETDSQGQRQIGGWAVVNRIQEAAGDHWIAVTEYMNTSFSWKELRTQQEALRIKHGLDHALTK